MSKLLFDFFPLLLFFAAYKFYGIFVAAGVAIAASAIQVGAHWLRHHRLETIHLVTFVVILVFGGLTILLRDELFIKWKPTIVNWLFALIVFGTQFIGRKTALERVMGNQLELPGSVWRNVNLSWGLFFVVVGALNVYIAFYFRPDLDPQARTEFWVNFKVFGLLGLTFVFAVAQMAFLYRHIELDEGEEDG